MENLSFFVEQIKSNGIKHLNKMRISKLRHFIESCRSILYTINLVKVSSFILHPNGHINDLSICYIKLGESFDGHEF